MNNSGIDRSKPLLIYDGDCGFCAYWASYWHKLTGNKVNFAPYQEVADDFPRIPLSSFKRAVQYVATDGTIAAAAKASFLTLSHAESGAFWLWLYLHIPGFAFIAERGYAFIAAHRSFFYKISLWLWGADYEPPQYKLISWLFLRIFGLIFLSAFVSFGVQALGLIGSQGILPLPGLVDAARNQLGMLSYWIIPMVFWLNASDLTIQAVCWGGVLFSLLLVFNVLPRFSLMMLYLLYISLVSAGQIFMSFQWDSFILETAVLAIFLCTRFQTLGIWLLRWLLFRFIFAGGLVKIMSGDPTWQDLSAVSYHFLTQPLPSPLAWYASHLPTFMFTIATGATLFIELVMPFFIFFPRHLRFISAFAILFLQVLILLSGNYNFFNILTILLCLVLFDDAALRKIIPSHFARRLSSSRRHFAPNKFYGVVTSLFVACSLILSLVEFQIKFIGSVPTPLLILTEALAPLRLVNIYGPFSVMTTQRREIIFEGSEDGMTWREYAFKYKPGDVYRPPLWNIPHQPRLDWQLWFAALGSINDNPWVLYFMQRVLQNSPEVLGLLEDNPFPFKAPQYLRAKLYDYRFTSSEEREKTRAWWVREYLWIYCPEVHLS